MRKPKIGRPKVRKENLRGVHTAVMLTSKKRKTMEKVAEQLGKNISGFLNLAIDDAVDKYGTSNNRDADTRLSSN